MRKQDPQLVYFSLLTISLSLLCSLALFQMSKAGLFNPQRLKMIDDRELIRPAPDLVPPVTDEPTPPIAIVDGGETLPPATPEPQQETSQIHQAGDPSLDESDCLELIEDSTSSREFEVVIWNPLSDEEKAERKQREEEVEAWINKLQGLEIELSEAKSRSKRHRLMNQLIQMKIERAQEIVTKYPEKIVQHRAKFVNGRKMMEELVWLERNDELAARCRREKIHPAQLGILPYSIGTGRDPEIAARFRALSDQYGARATPKMFEQAMHYEDYVDLTPRD